MLFRSWVSQPWRLSRLQLELSDVSPHDENIEHRSRKLESQMAKDGGVAD